MSFDPAIYGRSCIAYDEWVRAVDEPLYELCRCHPDHGNCASVAAKCWIIGRTYATGIERQIASEGRQGDSMSKLVCWLLRHHRRVDALIERLLSLKEPLNVDSLCAIVGVHGRFVQLLSGIVREAETPRSFAAKYLHFHCPIVPIYDSVVTRVIPGRVRWRHDLIAFPEPAQADGDYARFCYRFWYLYEQARKSMGRKATVKLLDYYLLYLGGGPA